MKTLRLDWKEFDQFIAWMDNLFKPRMIITEMRGGLPIATALAHRWKQKEIYTQSSALPDGAYLWVDDILDSGRTYLQVREKFNNNYGRKLEEAVVWVTKTVFKSRNSRTELNYYRQVDQDTWVIFPWEDPNGAEEDRKQYEISHS